MIALERNDIPAGIKAIPFDEIQFTAVCHVCGEHIKVSGANLANAISNGFDVQTGGFYCDNHSEEIKALELSILKLSANPLLPVLPSLYCGAVSEKLAEVCRSISELPDTILEQCASKEEAETEDSAGTNLNEASFLIGRAIGTAIVEAIKRRSEGGESSES